ncbi:hypothetical protein TSUD_294990 [Trifolium subterraneum]|uniref:ABC-2 type transporter transmembrane domain-containing protein n=1 Tax=Trifolium subterraneum TaxID=3900 RepID=A0A2Z6M851_TRISU|nr:hypothetical protein TSUD_294990 [Trifolium subterraneum]
MKIFIDDYMICCMQFFAQAGFPCPALRNPSDHFLRCINSDFDKVKATLKGSMKLRFEGSDDPLDKITTAEAIRTLVDFYRTSQHSYAARQKVDEMSNVKGTVLEAGGSEASFLLQCYILTKRSFINMSRDFGYYWLRLVIYIVVTICIGTIYLNVGTGYNSILARGSCASFVFGFVTFMSIGGFPSFVEDMKGIFMLVSGYFRLPHDIPKPVWRYPMSYISFHFWALQGQYQNDLRGLVFDNQTPDLPKIPGEYILEYVFQITVTRSKWIDLTVILSMIVIYRIIFFIMIKINEDVTPWIRGYLARRRMQQKSGDTTIAPDVLTQSPSLRNYISNQK